MQERFSDRARHAMALANLEAGKLNHNFLTPAHLMLGLIAEGHAHEVRRRGGEVQEPDVDVAALALAARCTATEQVDRAHVFALAKMRY